MTLKNFKSCTDTVRFPHEISKTLGKDPVYTLFHKVSQKKINKSSSFESCFIRNIRQDLSDT